MSAYNSRRPRTVKPLPPDEVADLIAKMKRERSGMEDYRERSLKIHGSICAKCGREFNDRTIHLLTVHHKDGNHLNNPRDGSNWENLCVYCHDDEHNRSNLGDYLNSK